MGAAPRCVGGLRRRAALALMCCLSWPLGAAASDRWVQLPTGRSGATTPSYQIPSESAAATIILLPGGDADTGSIVDDKPGSNNFLSRSRDLFARQGFNVMVLYRPTDRSGMDNRYRASSDHMAELREAIVHARREFGKPVWLVGTSKGTISAAAAAIELGPDWLAGVVLTATITHMKSGGVSSLALGRARVPMLMVHHERDECRVCVPQEARAVAGMFSSAPVKRFVMVKGGSDPRGDPCHARHWHGFINYEREVVELISTWIRQPSMD